MSLFRRAGLLMSAAILAIACGGGGQPTTAPSTSSTNPTPAPTTATETSAPATEQPATEQPSADASGEPTTAPADGLDPSQSDAGIAARVTISNDTNMGRDGTYDMYGVDADGSECDGSFEEPEYIVVAWHDDAANGEIHRFGITVQADQIPAEDGSTTDITDGRLSFDFVSESGFGTQYTAAPPDDGTLTLDITREGSSLTFDFEGATTSGVNLVGQFICAEA